MRSNVLKLSFGASLAAIATLAAVTLLFTAAPAQATTYVTSSSGSWNQPTVWTPNGIPGASDTATIPCCFTVNLDSSRSIGSLSVAGTLNLSTFTLSATNAPSLTGTISGTSPGKLTISGTGDWSAGTWDSSGTVEVLPGGTLTISSGLAKTLQNGFQLVASGNVVWSGGTILDNTGSLISIPSGGVFDCQSDNTIAQNSGNGSVINSGTFQKTAGTGTTTVSSGVPFSSSGRLQGSSGSFDIQSLTLNSGAILGNGFSINSGTTRIGGASQVESGATVTFNGGTLAGPLSGSAGLTVNGTLNWTGGTMDGAGGSVTIAAGTNSTISGGTTKVLSNSFQLIIPGTMTWTGGSILINTTSLLSIPSGGVFDCQNDGVISQNSGNGSISNSGTFKKTAGPATATVGSGVPFTSDGRIQVSSGSFDIQNLTLNTGAILGNGFSINSGTTTIAGASQIENGATVTLAGGTLSGTSTLTVNGTLNWTGGVMNGAGGAVSVPAGKMLNISGAATKTMQNGFQVLVSGTATWSGGTILDNTGSLLSIQSGGLFDSQANNSITQNSGAGSVSNAGTFRKTNGGVDVVGSGVPFDNSGVLQEISGTFNIQTLNLHPGSVIAGLTISSGTTSVLGASTVQTGKTLSMTGGTLNGSATLTVNGTLDFSGGAMSGGAVVDVVSGGLFLFSGTATKTLQNGFDLNVFGTARWTGGSILDNTSTTFDIQPGGTFDIQTDDVITQNSGNGTISNAGTILKSAGTGAAVVAAGVPVTSSGAINIQSGTFSAANLTLAAGTTIAGSGLTINSGTTSVNGASTVQSGATLNLASGGVLGGGAALTVNGTLSWTGGTMDGLNASATIASGGVLNITTATTKVLSNGFNLNIAGTANWSGGTILDNTGAVLHVLSGGLFNSQSNDVITQNSGAGTIVNDGIFRKSAGGGTTTTGASVAFANNNRIEIINGNSDFQNLTLNNGSVISGSGFTLVNGTTNIAGPSSVEAGATMTIASGTLSGTADLAINGTLNWTGGVMNGAGGSVTIASGTTSTISTATTKVLQNSFTLNVAGTLNWTGGTILVNTSSLLNIQSGGVFDSKSDDVITQNSGAGSITNAGTFRKSAGTGTTTIGVNVPFSNNARIDITSGTSDFQQLFLNSGAFITGSGFRVANGATTISGPSSVQSGATMTVAGGTLNGSSTLTINGTLSWSGGTMDGGATLAVAPAGVANLIGTTKVLSNGFSFKNGGTVHWTAGSILDNTSAILHNLAGGVFQIECDDVITQNSGAGSILNAGILRKLTTSGTTTIGSGVPFTSTGEIDMQTGILQVTNPTFNSTSVLRASLAGTTALTQYGRLAVTGAVSINGTLAVSLLGGYTPNNGDSYTPLTFASRGTTDFSGTSYQPYGGGSGGTFTYSYTPSSLVLTAVVSTDLSASQSAPASVLHGQNATFTITVSNNALANATNVVLNDTFSGGSFVSVTPSSGTCSGTGPITCNFGTIPVNTSVTVTLVLNANAVGTITNTASVTATESDPNTTNNTVTNNVTVNPDADLSLAITDAPDPVNPGASTTYTVTLANGGPDAASTVSVSLTLSGGTIASVTSGSFSCSVVGAVSTCSAASLAPGSYTISLTGTAGASGVMTLNGSASSTTADPAPGNESASQSTTINATDLSIVKSGPSTALPGSQITYTISVTNLGPIVANAVVVDDIPPSRLTFVANSGACTTPFPCTIPSLAVGQTITISAKYTVGQTGASPITNVANVTASTADSNASNNSSSKTTTIGCPTTIPNTVAPADGATGIATSGTLNWAAADALAYRIFLGPAGSGCSIEFGSSGTNSIAYSGLNPGTDYEWRVEALRSGCPVRTSSCSKFRTASSCVTAPPVLLAPVNGSAALSPVEFKWSSVANATEYQLWVATGSGAAVKLATTATTSFIATIDDGPAQWYVIAITPDCGALQSATGSFNNCNRPVAPIASVVGAATSGQTYKVEWNAVLNAVSYELEESETEDFSAPLRKSLTARSVPFTHITDVSKAFYYRVHAFSACTSEPGPFSEPVRVVLIPLPARTQKNPAVNVPAGNTDKVVQEVFIPGQANQTLQFTATVDRPWLTVAPANGPLPPEGVTLKITASPGVLPNGTFTASLIVVITTPSSSRYGAQGSSTVTVPVSVNVVTPVSPVPQKNAPSADSLIIPSIGHLDGINSHWQSDIRVTNIGGQLQKYALIFSPSDPKAGVKQTTIDVDAGATTALDDIVRNWYGIGTLGDAASGILEIRPLTSAAKGPEATTPSVSRATLVSSRTYNATSAGTLGQFIPAIPYTSFIAKPSQGSSPLLSLQQIAQSSAFRTNVGLIEGSGQSASAVLAVFDDAAKKLLELPFDLKANQQLQLSGLLAQNNISLKDGRIEVRVTKGDGRVTAYASTIDNLTNDPLLVAPVQIGQTLASKWVVPGVADLTNSIAHWQTDMRLFNSGASPQTVTLTFLPQGGGEPASASVTIPPSQVAALDAIVSSLFGKSNAGGMVQVTTPADAPLIITGRTYNQTGNGTLGQFTPAVTLADGAAAGGRSLNILQVEDSVRYRTNLGLAELNGKPVTVEVQVVLPDSKVTPTVQIPLAANEFRQSAIIRELGLGNVYNARINIRVIGGDGVVTAYASVIDQETQDPTYVAAQ